MKYSHKKFDKRTLITSILAGEETPRRIKEGEKVNSEDLSLPLFRSVSTLNKPITTREDGLYFLAYKDPEDGWTVIDTHRFGKANEAHKYLEGMHVFYGQVAVVQFYDDGIWEGLTRDDPTDFGHEEQGEDEEYTGEDEC